MKAQVSQFTVKATVVAVDEDVDGYKLVEIEGPNNMRVQVVTRENVNVGDDAAISRVIVDTPILLKKS